MKIQISAILFVSMITALLSSCADEENICIIEGEISNVDYDTLIIMKTYESAWSANTYIPIVDGKFHYELSYGPVQAQQLAFKQQVETGEWQSYLFFPRRGKIKISISDDYESTVIKGGKLNKAYKSFKSELTNQYKTIQPYIGTSFDF